MQRFWCNGILALDVGRSGKTPGSHKQIFKVHPEDVCVPMYCLLLGCIVDASHLQRLKSDLVLQCYCTSVQIYSCVL